MFIGQKF